ncbi:MAG TPA: hypothetical protein PKM27_02130 [Saprospiraceae bacterium]|nr:hypothetical protein [Saprospiraceae bacterium]HNT20618.1 hypothetical protein [Saprospiraceae bacterium]
MNYLGRKCNYSFDYKFLLTCFIVFLTLFACQKESDSIIKLEIKPEASQSLETHYKLAQIFENKKIIEFEGYKEFQRVAKFCIDNIDLLTGKIENGEIIFESPFRDFIMAEIEMNKIKSEEDWFVFKNKWSEKVTIRDHSIDPKYLMYSKNILCNLNGILKIGNKYHKYFDDFYASSNELNLLVNYKETDRYKVSQNVTVYEIKNSCNIPRSGSRANDGSISCVYTVNPSGCNKRRIQGFLDWESEVFDEPGLPTAYTFNSQSTTRYQYLSIVWLNRDADTINATVSHRIDIVSPPFSDIFSGSDVRTNSKLAIAYANPLPFAHPFTVSQHTSTHIVKRDECNTINLSCNNYSAN